MKDLKHMVFFESLLHEANNDLVRQATSEGRLALGYTCFHIPEALLNLPGCFSVRLRAPHMGSTDIATYYMASSACEFCRALLERAIEGGFQFLDAIVGVDLCEGMNRCYENMEILKTYSPDKEGKFFISYIDVPSKDEEIAVEHIQEQIERKYLKPLHENYGIDISDAAIRKAVEDHNEVCRVITEIGNFRKAENPVITGSEFHKIVLASFVAPKDLIIDKLYETLDELKTREPDKKSPYRARVVVVGGEIDDPGMIELIEESGAYVAADRFCFGSIPGRQEIILNDDEPALTQVIRTNVQQTACPRYMSHNKIKYRQDQAAALCKEYNADGIIYEQMKFCTYWSFERALQSNVLYTDYGIPTLSIDRPYRARNSGQLRTRVQAFVERLEIKNIKAEREAENK